MKTEMTGVMAEVLQKGMRFWRNPKNKYAVLEVRYDADPDKDPDTKKGAAWHAAEREKYHSAQKWEREMEINWHASAGKRFYDEFSREEHVAALQVNLSLPIHRAWDFGYHHPAVLWFQIDRDHVVNGMPRFYILRECMGTDISIEAFAVREILPQYRGLIGTDGKPARFKDCCDAAGTQKNDKSERTSIEMLRDIKDEHGRSYVRHLRYRKIGIKPGCDKVRKLIESGQLIVDPACKILIDGFLGGYTFPEWKQGMSRQQAETPAESDFSHLMDALRYAVVNFMKKEADKPDQTDKTDRTMQKRRKKSRFVGPGNRR